MTRRGGPVRQSSPSPRRGGSKNLHAPLPSRLDPPARPFPHGAFPLDDEARLKRLRFRAWHRGTREADLLIGGFFDSRTSWTDAEADWFEALLEEQDVDIMAWAIGTAAPPERFAGRLMNALQSVDYIKHPR